MVNRCFVPLRMTNFKQLPPSTDFYAANKQYFLKNIPASIKRLPTPVLNISFKKCFILFTKVFYGNIHTVIQIISKVIHCLLNKNKALKMFGHKNRCSKNRLPSRTSLIPPIVLSSTNIIFIVILYLYIQT